MAISQIANNATGTQIAAAVNAIITLLETTSTDFKVVKSVVESSTTGNAALKAKLDEVFDTYAFASKSPAATEYTIPEGEIEVTISTVVRTFTFNLPRFTYQGTTYVAADLVETLSSDTNDGYTDAVTLITALVAAGSVITDGTGSGILTETTT